MQIFHSAAAAAPDPMGPPAAAEALSTFLSSLLLFHLLVPPLESAAAASFKTRSKLFGRRSLQRPLPPPIRPPHFYIYVKAHEVASERPSMQ